MFQVFCDIAKIDAEQRMVYGYASTEAMDSQGEIIERSAIQMALPDYLKFPTIREMHQPSAAGFTEAATVDEKGLYIGAKIIDDQAWNKVKSGVYKGFSVGGRALKRDAINKKKITKMDLHEISLVDRPSNPGATFDIWKRDMTEQTSKDTVVVTDPADDADKIAKAAVDRAAEFQKAADLLAKGMDTVSSLACLLEQVRWLQRDAEVEALFEKDGSTQPEQFRAWLADGARLLVSVVAEEAREIAALGMDGTVEGDNLLVTKVAAVLKRTAALKNQRVEKAGPRVGDTVKTDTISGEIVKVSGFLSGADVSGVENDTSTRTAEIKVQDGTLATVQWDDLQVKLADDGAGATWVAKRGARHSAADKSKIQSMHDHAVDLGADCSAAGDSEMAKLGTKIQALPKDSLTIVKGLLAAQGEHDVIHKADTVVVPTLEDIRRVVALSGETLNTGLANVSLDLKKVGGVLTESTALIEALTKRVLNLESQPAAPKGSTREITKEADSKSSTPRFGQWSTVI